MDLEQWMEQEYARAQVVAALAKAVNLATDALHLHDDGCRVIHDTPRVTVTVDVEVRQKPEPTTVVVPPVGAQGAPT